MSWTELQAVLPVALPALAATAVMLAGGFGGGHRLLHALALAGMALSLLSVLWVGPLAPVDVTPLLRLDATALFFMTVIYAAVGLLVVISRPYLEARRRDPEAFYTLLLFAATGMGVLACSDHFASFFLGLETLTVALYALIGYLKTTPASLEAALKYLVLAALSSGILLFGIALLYAASGTLEIAPALQTLAGVAGTPAAEGVGGLDGAAGMAPVAATGTAGAIAAAAAQDTAGLWAVAGTLLLLVGFGFKLAVVPFHMWSPDVYQGAPAPVTALIATGSKGAVLAVLLRALTPADLAGGPVLLALAVLCVATMFVGNLLALLQDDLKRLLAYSSVAHLGYLLVAVVAGGRGGAEAVAFYVLVYVPMTLGAFGVVTVLSSEAEADADSLRGYRGLGRQRPLLAATLTLMLLSLAGIPPTGGFLAKFAVLGAALDAGRPGLALAMALASGLALFYYLRVIVVMYMEGAPEGAAAARGTRAPRGTAGAAAVPATGSTVGGGAKTDTQATAGTEAAADRRTTGGGVPIGSALALAAISLAILAIGLWPSPWLDAVAVAVAALLPA